jgi:carboxylesterase type B
VKPTQGESDLVKAFQDAWVSFARTGTPPTFWGMYDRQKDNYVTFDTPMSGGEHLRKDQCDYWDKLPPL